MIIRKKTVTYATLIALTVLLANIVGKIRFLISPDYGEICNLIRSLIYIILFLCWGISFNKRIIQNETRRCFLGVSFLIVFWMVVRTIKFNFAIEANTIRYLWYLYYVPLLFIPTLALIIAITIGKKEDYKLPTKYKFLLLPPTVLSILVLTNDFHQLVFKIPNLNLWQDGDKYFYGFGSILCYIWIITCGLVFFITLIKKCRFPNKKFIFLPFIPVAISACYSFVHVFNIKPILFLFGDFPAFQSLFFIITLECCIQCGLIRANTCYDELFEASAEALLITDNNLKPLITSKNDFKFSQNNLKDAINSSYNLGNNRTLNSAKIHNGYVFWTENTKVINDLLNKLEITNRELQGRNDLLVAENELRKNETKIDTENRLYGRITKETKSQIKEIEKLIEDGTCNKAFAHGDLCKICFLGAYIKRRSNLIILNENQNSLPAEEVTYCIRESLNNLELSGVLTYIKGKSDAELSISDALKIYDLFEEIIESTYEKINAVSLNILNGDEFINYRFMIGLKENSSCNLVEELKNTLKNEAIQVHTDYSGTDFIVSLNVKKAVK